MPAPSDFDGKLGDPYSTREITVRKLLAVIGRDVDLEDVAPRELPATVNVSDPEAAMAWDALVEVTADVLSLFNLVTTFPATLDPSDNPNSLYLLPLSRLLDVQQDTGAIESLTNTRNISGVRVIDQPPDLNLIWRGDDFLIDAHTGFSQFEGRGPARVDITVWARWETLPYVFRRFIFVSAGRILIQRAVGAADYISFTQQDEQRAFARMQQYVLNAGPVNLFTGSGSGEREMGNLAGILDRFPF